MLLHVHAEACSPLQLHMLYLCYYCCPSSCASRLPSYDEVYGNDACLTPEWLHMCWPLIGAASCRMASSEWKAELLQCSTGCILCVVAVRPAYGCFLIAAVQ
jgi:hypothetical protein